jgi:CRP-like cAMP-binding protein
MRWSILASLDPDEQRSVLSSARRCRFRKGETVFREGDLGESFHLIDKGRVAVRVTTQLGDVVTLTILGPGDSFGEQALLHEGRRTASIVALEATETLALRRDVFEQLRAQHHAVDQIIISVLAEQVRRLSASVVEALYINADERVVRRLQYLARLYQDGGDEVVIPLTQDVLATMAGTTRPTVNRVLRRLEAGGVVSTSRGRITVCSVEVLDRSRTAGAPRPV